MVIHWTKNNAFYYQIRIGSTSSIDSLLLLIQKSIAYNVWLGIIRILINSAYRRNIRNSNCFMLKNELNLQKRLFNSELEYHRHSWKFSHSFSTLMFGHKTISTVKLILLIRKMMEFDRDSLQSWKLRGHKTEKYSTFWINIQMEYVGGWRVWMVNVQYDQLIKWL